MTATPVRRSRRGVGGRPYGLLALGVALTLVATVAGPAAGGGPASASSRPGSPLPATSDPAATGAELALVSQPPWIALDGAGTLTLDVAPEVPVDTMVRLRLYGRVRSLDTFSQTLAGERLGERISTRRLPLLFLPRDAADAVRVTFGIGRSGTLPTLAATRPGVYPLEIALEAQDTIASFVTWLVVVDNTTAPVAEEPLRVAFVVTATAAPARDADGTPDPSVLAELAPGGRLDRVAAVVTDSRAPPLTLQVGPETLESWVALAAGDPVLAPGAERLSAAAARPENQLLPTPYVPIDVAALEAAGLGAELPDQLAAGADALAAITDRRPDPGTALADPAVDPVLERLHPLLVDRVVVRDDQLADRDDEPPLRPFVIESSAGALPAVAATSFVHDLLDGDEPAALRAQRATTALALVALDDPDVARGLVLVPPRRWSPDADVYTDLFEALRAHPLLRLVTVDSLFAEVEPERDDDALVVRELDQHEPRSFPFSAARYERARRDHETLRIAVPADDAAVQQGARALLLALSTDQRATEAQAHLAVIDAAVQQLSASVATTQKRVTVTSRRADIPIDFHNSSERTVRARVRLQSTKLLFPGNDDMVVELPPGNTTRRFTVEARTSGTFPMTVTVTTPDGRIALGAPTRLTVRSTAFSGVGATITIGALVFLALWWGNHIRRTRRSRRAARVP